MNCPESWVEQHELTWFTFIPHLLASSGDFKASMVEYKSHSSTSESLDILRSNDLPFSDLHTGSPTLSPSLSQQPPVLQPCGTLSLHPCQCYFFSLWYPFQSLVYQSDISLPTVQNLDQVSPPCWHLFALYSFVLPHSCHSELVSLLFCSYNIYTYFLHHLQLCTFISLLIYFLILHWKHFQLRFPVSTVLPVSQHLAKGFAHRRHFLNVYWISGWMDGRNERVFECGITITVVIVIK